MSHLNLAALKPPAAGPLPVAAYFDDALF